jgi:D-alanyl-D-alanine carboxypeptidase
MIEILAARWAMDLLRVTLFLLAILAALWAAPAQARYAAIIVDAQSGTVIESIDATTRWYPASLTKVMTVYLAFEDIEAGKLKLDEELSVSAHAASQPATELGLGAGEKITVKDAILAVILQSANDAAVVLAERMGGDEVKFAERMTAKAAQLGMIKTVFRNASGLPDPQQVTTARDMAVLATAVLENYPQYYHFFSTTSFTYQGTTFGTINGILSRYPGADGIKTGFTCGSGYNLVASATRDGRRLIGVLLGGESSWERHEEMGRLLDIGFAADLAKMPHKLRLADLAVERVHEDSPPPNQLDANECAYGVSETSTTAGISVSSGRKLPGWGIIVGSFPSKGEAQAAIRSARSNLSSVMGGGRPAIVSRQWEGMKRYNALLVGLKKEQAGKACLHLWNKGAYCMALAPVVLNNPNAVWR